jgi:hypothetical protein
MDVADRVNTMIGRHRGGGLAFPWPNCNVRTPISGYLKMPAKFDTRGKKMDITPSSSQDQRALTQHDSGLAKNLRNQNAIFAFVR